jgi:hypothetical protein
MAGQAVTADPVVPAERVARLNTTAKLNNLSQGVVSCSVQSAVHLDRLHKADWGVPGQLAAMVVPAALQAAVELPAPVTVPIAAASVADQRHP